MADPKSYSDPLDEPPAYGVAALETARELALAGASRAEIAKALGISLRTLRQWRLAHPEFDAALAEWRQEADDDVEQALWRKAAEGDVNAARFWLTNRRGDSWRNKTDVAAAGDSAVVIITGVPPRESATE